eukprot:739170-Rhodomonas_salina.1
MSWAAAAATVLVRTATLLRTSTAPVSTRTGAGTDARLWYCSGMVVPLILVTCVGFFSLFMPAPPSGARPALRYRPARSSVLTSHVALFVYAPATRSPILT